VVGQTALKSKDIVKVFDQKGGVSCRSISLTNTKDLGTDWSTIWTLLCFHPNR
jgi:hypothetical protein